MLKDFTQDKYDIFIQAGQSNSEGYGVGNVEDPYQPNESVYYLNNDFTISKAAELVSGNEMQSNFGLSFAREYMNAGLLKEGRKILILRAAVGGTSFLGNHWKIGDELYVRMMDMIRTALELNQENRLVGLLWHQGESDATENASYEVHYNHLMTLLRSVRDTFQVPKLPFIAADFVHQWKDENPEIVEPVVKAIRAVCNDCGYGAFIETDGLNSNYQDLGRASFGWEDHIHFSRKSHYKLGKLYFDAFVKIK